MTSKLLKRWDDRMTVSANGYVLNVPSPRRQILLTENEYSSSFYRDKPYLSEPVPKFKHPQNVPLLVFCSFEDGMLTHIANGKRGNSAGTGLQSLHLSDLEAFGRPISYDKLVTEFSPNISHHLKRVVAGGGLLPPKTLNAFVDHIISIEPSIAGRLARYSSARYEALARLKDRERENLALQKEAVGTALMICGIPRDELSEWQPLEGQSSFLDGLPKARVREDTMLLKDFDTIPGFTALSETTHIGSKVFQSSGDNPVRLIILMANRTPLEEQTGTDLIYFNDTYRGFIMVQYKAMEQAESERDTSEKEAQFRWQDGDQFAQELERMDNMIAELNKIQLQDNPDGFRFSSNPFFLKFCPRVAFNPDNMSLTKGMYIPLDLWKKLIIAGKLKGKKGGNLVTFNNVSRYITNTDFVSLVSGSWVGTFPEQSALLTDLIREILISGKSVTYAIEHSVSVAAAID